MKSLSRRKKETFLMFGVEIPKWKDCPECGAEASCEFQTYTYAARCSKCQKRHDKENKQTVSKDKTGFYVKRFKDVVAFYKTPDGRTVGSDGKGHFYDSSETGYDLKRDPYGWKATGKKK